MSHPVLADCQSCQFYRPQASFVDAYKDFDRNPPREPVMKSLLDLRKDETHVQENEMELQVELMMTEQKTWPTRPRFAPLCVFADSLFLPASKNPDGRCTDYKLALNRQGRACRTCQFLVRPETKIGDRREMPTGAGGSQETAFYRELNKEQDNADAMAQALEIEQTFVGDGCLPNAYFLPTCGVKVTDSRRNVPPFCNLRNDCQYHHPHIALPDALIKWVEGTTSEGNDRAKCALEHTTIVAQLVAKWGIHRPAEHLAELAAWVREDPSSRWGVAVWAASCLYPRWAVEAPKDSNAAKIPAYQPGGPMPGEWPTPPSSGSEELLPFVAGCDAYEWGLVAAYSKSSPAGAKYAATVICQQLTEFIACAISPLEGAACIDAAIDFIGSRGLFADATTDLVKGFLLRLRNHGEKLRLLAQTDLQQYFEDLVAALSYKVGAWTTLQWRDPAFQLRIDAADPEVGDRLRDLDKLKLAEAYRQGASLLEDIVAVATGTLSIELRIQRISDLLASNDISLDRDKADSVKLIGEACEALAKKSGIDKFMDQPIIAGQSMTYRDMLKDAIRLTFGSVYDIPRAMDNPRRKARTTLLFNRGACTVTPTALEVLDRKPIGARMPESFEQALSDPTVPTLEAYHASQYPSAALESYRTKGRRLGAPRYVQKK